MSDKFYDLRTSRKRLPGNAVHHLELVNTKYCLVVIHEKVKGFRQIDAEILSIMRSLILLVETFRGYGGGMPLASPGTATPFYAFSSHLRGASSNQDLSCADSMHLLRHCS